MIIHYWIDENDVAGISIAPAELDDKTILRRKNLNDEPTVKPLHEVFNPVQLSAQGMNGPELKEKYGKQLTFWGGGIDTLKTLSFGTVDEVRAEARKRLEVFSPDVGFVFNTIHNIVGNTPVENIIALFDEVRSFNHDSGNGL